MPHLQTIRSKRTKGTRGRRSVVVAEPGSSQFPFSVPAIANLTELDVAAPVTFLVGENGCGKSTLLEGVALAAGLPTVGSAELPVDATLAAQRALAKALVLVWKTRVHRGFFLRAEDFFGFQRRLERERSELEARLGEIDREYEGRSAHAIGLAKGPVLASIGSMEARYGRDPDARSHGEAFLALFRSRFSPGGLYLLDEPEAPLSPQNQIGLLAMLLEMVKQDSQFIIATHSPILLATPGARIFRFEGSRIVRAAFEDLEHVKLTREFLNDPSRFLRHFS